MGMQVSYQGLGTILTSENDKIFIPTKFAEINKSTGYVWAINILPVNSLKTNKKNKNFLHQFYNWMWTTDKEMITQSYCITPFQYRTIS